MTGMIRTKIISHFKDSIMNNVSIKREERSIFPFSLFALPFRGKAWKRKIIITALDIRIYRNPQKYYVSYYTGKKVKDRQ